MIASTTNRRWQKMSALLQACENSVRVHGTPDIFCPGLWYLFSVKSWANNIPGASRLACAFEIAVLALVRWFCTKTITPAQTVGQGQVFANEGFQSLYPAHLSLDVTACDSAGGPVRKFALPPTSEMSAALTATRGLSSVEIGEDRPVKRRTKNKCDVFLESFCCAVMKSYHDLRMGCLYGGLVILNLVRTK